MRILQVFTDLIQKAGIFSITETTFLTACIKGSITTKQQRARCDETNLLPLRFNGVWQTNASVLAPPAGLE